MSTAKAQLLRNNAATLRAKAATGEAAIATARSLSSRLQKTLLEKITNDLASGALEEAFNRHLDQAKDLGEDANAGALVAFLTDFVKDVKRISISFTEELMVSGAEAVGRARGIEEALEALTEKE